MTRFEANINGIKYSGKVSTVKAGDILFVDASVFIYKPIDYIIIKNIISKQ